MYCDRCDLHYETHDQRWRCRCGGALDLLLPAPQIALDLIQSRAPDLWRYREALPPLPRHISLGESVTPLIPVAHRGRDIWLKCDYLLPTGSYKDRGAAVLISHLRAIGIQRAVEDSSGNAAASLAAYAARAGIDI